jgi:hypothetical protein
MRPDHGARCATGLVWLVEGKTAARHRRQPSGNGEPSGGTGGQLLRAVMKAGYHCARRASSGLQASRAALPPGAMADGSAQRRLRQPDFELCRGLPRISSSRGKTARTDVRSHPTPTPLRRALRRLTSRGKSPRSGKARVSGGLRTWDESRGRVVGVRMSLCKHRPPRGRFPAFGRRRNPAGSRPRDANLQKYPVNPRADILYEPPGWGVGSG